MPVLDFKKLSFLNRLINRLKMKIVVIVLNIQLKLIVFFFFFLEKVKNFFAFGYLQKKKFLLS